MKKVVKDTIKGIFRRRSFNNHRGSSYCLSPSTSKLHYLIFAEKWRQATKRVRLSPNDAQWIGEDGSTVLHHALLLSAPMNVIDAIVRAYPAAVGIQDEAFGVTPLHVAAEICSAEVIKILVLSPKDQAKSVPHTASEYGLSQVTNFATADEMKNSYRRDQVTPSPYCSCEAHTALLKQDNRGLTALHRAIKKNRLLDVINIFVEACPEAITMKSNNSLTPVQEAYAMDAPGLIKQALLSHLSFGPN